MKTIKKMKTRLLTIACTIVMVSFTTGCSKDNLLNPAGNCFGGNWAEGYTAELQTWSAAIAAYSENPTLENCANYKTAAKGYLDALNGIYDCVPTGSKAEFDTAIKEAKADVDRDGCD